MHSSEFLPDDITLMDIAYCFEWKMVIYSFSTIIYINVNTY